MRDVLHRNYPFDLHGQLGFIECPSWVIPILGISMSVSWGLRVAASGYAQTSAQRIKPIAHWKMSRASAQATSNM